jgi:predicted esterase
MELIMKLKVERMMARLLITVICVITSVTELWAQNWKPQFETFLKAPPGPKRDSLFNWIVAADPDWRDVVSKIESIPFQDTVKGFILLDSTTCIDGVTRPYAISIPSDYNPKIPTSLIVHLHGIVGRPVIDPDPLNYVANIDIMAEAEKRGWFVLFPFGQQDATWFDKVGMTNIMTLVRAVKSKFNIDDNRVFLSGLSDGASAAFLFAMVMPTDFAAYVSLNGSMGVGSEDGGFSTYAPNLSNTFIYATNADRDKYYPTSQMTKTIDMAMKSGANILYRKLTGEHIGSLEQVDYPAIFDYLEKHPRNASPGSIVWETASPQFGACKWLAIDEISNDNPAEWHIDHNVTLVDSTIAIGFIQNDSFPGPGVWVASVSDGDYVGRKIGLRPGDIIVKGNNTAIDSMADINKFKTTLKRGSEISLTVKRGPNDVVLQGEIPAPRTYQIFNRDKPSAMIKALYANNRFDISGSRVGAFRVLISPKMVDLTKKVIVTFNGNTIFDSKITPDIGYIFRDFLTNRDRKLIFVNEIAFRPAASPLTK